MTSTPRSRSSNFPLVLLKSTASLGLLAYVLYTANVRSVVAVASSVDTRYVAPIFLLIYLAIVVNSWEWGLIVRSRLAPVRLGALIRYYLVGLFFSSLLPTAIGGDVVRGYEISRDTGDSTRSAASIVSDRLISGSTLGLTALVGLAFVPRSPRLVLTVLLFAVGCVAFVAMVVHPRLLPAMIRSVSPDGSKAAHWTERTAADIRGTLRDRPLVGRVGAFALLSQVLISLIVALIFRSLGENIGIGYALVYVPVISALTMLPISLSGLGVREAAYVYFFTRLGIPAADAVAASLIFFLAVAVASLPGAVLFVLGRRSAAAVCAKEAIE